MSNKSIDYEQIFKDVLGEHVQCVVDTETQTCAYLKEGTIPLKTLNTLNATIRAKKFIVPGSKVTIDEDIALVYECSEYSADISELVIIINKQR